MRLTKATFDNFRCFKEYNIDFGKETTIFFGKNGSGKSSILSGTRRGLSFLFAKPKTFNKNLATSNNAIVKSFGSLEANFDSLSRTYNYPIRNDFEAVFNKSMINWSMVKTSMNGGLLTTNYNSALATVLTLYNTNNTAPLPVLAVFTDSFPHEKMNYGKKVRTIIQQDTLPRDLGYYGWDDRTNCMEMWLNRYYKAFNFVRDSNDNVEALEEQILLYEKLIDNKDEHDQHKVEEWEDNIVKLTENLNLISNDKRRASFSSEQEFIANKLIDFTRPLSSEYGFINQDFELFRIAVNRLDKMTHTLEFSFKDGRVMSFDALPMGYKRIFSIVLDVAYRSYILNAAVQSEGVVLIDEIELHLHPTLQQEILQRLKKTFPLIQFIITTHSPLVLSNFKSNNNNKIIKLQNQGNYYKAEPTHDTFGLDYSTNLSEMMDVAPRASTIEKYINGYLFLYGKGKNEDAEKFLDKLREYVGGTISPLLQYEIDKRKEQYKS